jgi:hypothetical protein
MKELFLFRLRGYRLIFVAALVLAPLAFLLYHVESYGVDVPYMDEWSMISAFDQYYSGSLRIIDLTAPHFEHRPFFPRTLILLMGTATGWNIKYELRINIAFAFLTLALFCLLLWHSTPHDAGGDTVWLFPLLSVVVFSLRQSINWLSGWQIAIFLNILAVAGGLITLRFVDRRHWLLIPSMLLGVVATYSFANGLLFWPLGLIAIAIAGFESRTRKTLYVLCFASVSVVAWITYFSRYTPEPRALQLEGILREPWRYLKYVASYLGSPISSARATKLGAFGIVIAGFAHWALLIKRRTKLQRVLPFSLLTLYAIGSAIGTGFGRGGFGIGQATTSRYVTFGNLLWISNLSLLFLIFVNNAMEQTRKPHVWRVGRWLSVALIIVIGLLALRESRMSAADFEAFHRRVAPARVALLEGTRPYLLRRIDINPRILLRYREVLKHYGLSVFRGSEN